MSSEKKQWECIVCGNNNNDFVSEPFDPHYDCAHCGGVEIHMYEWVVAVRDKLLEDVKALISKS